MQDPLFVNKVLGALLTAGLLFFGIPQLADRLLGVEAHHGKEHELKLAYPIEIKMGGADSGAAAVIDLGTLLAAADPAAGQRRAGICKSCHTFEKGGADGTGPNLWGVVGRTAATHGGFNYTAALKAAGGNWTYERLDKFVENSQGYIPGTAMVQRFPKAAQRADILAYLATLSESPVPFPAPAPPVAEAPSEVPPEDAASTDVGAEGATQDEAPADEESPS